MTIEGLRNKIKEELSHAEELLRNIDGIVYSATLEETDRTAYMFGVVMIGTEGMADGDKIYLSLEGEIDINDVVNEEKLAADATAFRERIEGICARLAAAEDKGAEILAIGGEMDRELDERYQAELDRLNATTKSNLRVALTAAGVLVAVAAICILIGVLF